MSLGSSVLGFDCVSGSRKAQVSLELLTTLGIVVAFTVPVLFLLLSVSSAGYEDTAKDQADATARSLADSINIVYAQGDGARREVLLNTPSSTESVEVTGNEVIVRIRVSEGPYEGVSPIFANISSSFRPKDPRAGLYPIVLENEKGKVKISEK